MQGASFKVLHQEVTRRRALFNKRPFAVSTIEDSLFDPDCGLCHDKELSDLLYFDQDTQMVFAQSQLLLAWRQWMTELRMEQFASRLEASLGDETND